jgi:hypothetical protein
LDWIGAVVDVANLLALVVVGIGVLYWYASKRLPVLTVANSVMLILLLATLTWLVVKKRR